MSMLGPVAAATAPGLLLSQRSLYSGVFGSAAYSAGDDSYATMPPPDIGASMAFFTQVRLVSQNPFPLNPGDPQNSAFPRTLCSSDATRHISLVNPVRTVRILQQPSGCVIGQPLERAPILQVHTPRRGCFASPFVLQRHSHAVPLPLAPRCLTKMATPLPTHQPLYVHRAG